MTTDELRAKFEATISSFDPSEFYSCFSLARGNNGDYEDDLVMAMWNGYRFGRASRNAEVEALRKDVERLNWLEQDMKAGSDGTSIYYCLGKFCYPYLGSSGVGEDSASTLREAVDAAMR